MIPTPILQMAMYLVNEVISFWLSLTASSSIPLDFSSKSVEELDRLREVLLPIRNGYSHCLLITTIIVTIGVIFEIFEIGIDTRNNLRRLRGSEEIPDRKLHSVLKLLGTIGWLLIVFGLVGEYFAEADINSADSNIEAVNDSILEKTQSAANSAQESANKANDALGEAQKKIRSIAKQSEALNKEMLDASARIDNLNVGAKIASREAGMFETQIIRLGTSLQEEQAKEVAMQKALSLRTLPVLTGPHGNTVSLQPFAGIRIILEYVPEAEAHRAADDVRNFVRYARWMSDDSDTSANPNLYVGFFDGVVIEAYDPTFDENGKKVKLTKEQTDASERSWNAASALIKCMNDAGWEKVRIYPGSALGKVPEDAIKIMIGMKPNRLNSPYQPQ
jgi:hypothetical protein